MSLSTVTLTFAVQDAGQDAGSGAITIAPTSVVTAAGQTVVSQQPVVRQMTGGAASVQVVATDSAGTVPAAGAWWYEITLPGGQPGVYLVDHANGATQRFDSLVPVNPPPSTAIQYYLPQPSGTPTAGYVPAATGTGEATTWTPPGGGGSGYPSAPVVSGTPSAGQVLTATSPTAADWQTPSGAGSGTVTTMSVVSANGLAGTVANPTTTPAVTLSTSVTGIPKGASGALVAATPGTDYLAPTGSGAALTGITAAQAGADASGAAATVQAASLQKASNLSDLASAGTARTNLGLGSAALLASSAVAQTANNLSDLASAATARTNLGLGTAATHPSTDFVATSSLPLGISSGGTGQATQQAALDALAGAVTSAQFLRGNGSHVALSAIQVADVPTLNQSTSGNAATATTAAACSGNSATATNLAGAAAFPAEVSPHVVTLTQVSSAVAVNGALGNVFRLVLTASGWTLSNPTGMTDGQPVRVRLIQDGTGSRTISYGSAWDFGAAGAPTLSTGASKVDYIVGEWSADANAGAGAVAVSPALGF